MAMLNRSKIKHIGLKEQVVELGDDMQVKLRELGLDQQLSSEVAGTDSKLFVYNMLMNCCIDEDGKPLFLNHNDIKELPASLMIKIFKACLDINNLGEKKLEDLAKN
jgi:hypothetical protein